MSTTITLEANLTADPDLRFTKTAGQAVATIRLAASSRRKDMDGEYQDTLVAAISERIIPTTDTPGAIAAGVPAYIEMMLADWYEPTDRNEFMTGLGVLEGHARVQFNRPFAGLAPEEQDLVLTQAMTGRVSGLAGNFFEHCRQLTVLGYYTSEVGCKQERVYLPVPGRYDGKYPYAQVRRVFSS